LSIFRPQAGQLGAADSGGVKDHEDGAVTQVRGGLNQAGNLLLAQDEGQVVRYLGHRQVIAAIVAPQGFEEQEAECRHLDPDSMGPQFAFLEEVQLVLPDVFNTELIGGTVKVFGEPPDSADVGACGSLRVITALEFVEHPFS
jgi:hypothetical protein